MASFPHTPRPTLLPSVMCPFSPLSRGLVLPALLVALALAGCNAPTATEAPAVPTAAAPTAAPPTATPAPGSYPQTHTDALGREVPIAARPQRIISLAPAITEALFAIGAGPQVVGRTTFDNYPPEVESLPAVGGFSASSISIEAILNLEPDLVIVGSSLQSSVVEALERTKVTAFALTPDSVAEIKHSILVLGEITGHAREAQATVADMEARIAAVTEKIKSIPPGKRVTVFYEVWHEPLTTATNATYIGELLTLAGGINIFGTLKGTYPNVSAEQVLALDPQAIIGPSSHADQLTPAVIAARPGWGKLTAVQRGAIHIVDGDIVSRPGPRLVDALEAIAAALYPDVFGN